MPRMHYKKFLINSKKVDMIVLSKSVKYRVNVKSCSGRSEVRMLEGCELILLLSA